MLNIIKNGISRNNHQTELYHFLKQTKNFCLLFVSSSEVMHSKISSLLLNISSDITYLAALCSSGSLVVVVSSTTDTCNTYIRHCCNHYQIENES